MQAVEERRRVRREGMRRWRRAQGIPELGSPEYLAKVRIAEPTYRAMHVRARKHLEGQSCAHCGNPEIVAALRHDSTPVARRLSPEGLLYSLNLDDYFPLCRLCHARHDGASERRKRWHARRKAAA